VKVVLFCGGQGRRIRNDPGVPPKPLVMIGDRPLLWHVMRYYAHFGHTDFILCLGHGAAAVKEFFLRYDETVSNDFVLDRGDLRLFSTDITDWSVTLVDTGLNRSIGERLMAVREHVAGEEVFLANYADTLTDADLGTAIDQFRRGAATASVLAVPPASTHHALLFDGAGLITRIVAMRDVVAWENGGYFILRPAIFDVLRRGEDLVPHALNRLVERGRLAARRHTGFWRAVDTAKDRADLEEMRLREDCPWAVWEAGPDPRPVAVDRPAGGRGRVMVG
jgi:glucose-1-phosphate cytidylyltransferase